MIEESKAYLVPSLREKVFAYMEKRPNANIVELYDEFKNYDNKKTIRHYKWEFRSLYAQTDLHEYKKYKKATKIVLDALTLKYVLAKALSMEESKALDALIRWVEEE